MKKARQKMGNEIHMNYIGHLTQEEKSILCEIITGKYFKKFFLEKENEFSKIQKGFRAKSLKEQHALSIATRSSHKKMYNEIG